MKTTVSIPAQVDAFVSACKSAGFAWSVRDSIVTIEALFTPEDREAFVRLDGTYGSVLALAPLKGGSVWGTDGGSVGGMVACRTGRFTMNKSGNGKRFLAALAKVRA